MYKEESSFSAEIAFALRFTFDLTTSIAELNRGFNEQLMSIDIYVVKSNQIVMIQYFEYHDEVVAI